MPVSDINNAVPDACGAPRMRSSRTQTVLWTSLVQPRSPRASARLLSAPSSTWRVRMLQPRRRTAGFGTRPGELRASLGWPRCGAATLSCWFATYHHKCSTLLFFASLRGGLGCKTSFLGGVTRQRGRRPQHYTPSWVPQPPVAPRAPALWRWYIRSPYREQRWSVIALKPLFTRRSTRAASGVSWPRCVAQLGAGSEGAAMLLPLRRQCLSRWRVGWVVGTAGAEAYHTPCGANRACRTLPGRHPGSRCAAMWGSVVGE